MIQCDLCPPNQRGGGGGHIAFGADPDRWILTKLALTHIGRGEKSD